MSVAETEFSAFLSSVASRLRHDLKGGLISLRMGLEALESEDDLKPLLLERVSDLEDLADKMVSLLRMGQLQNQPTRLSAVLADWRNRVGERWPDLEFAIRGDFSEDRPSIDGDALVLALCELAENAHHAGAKRLEVHRGAQIDELSLIVEDDGPGFENSKPEQNLTSCWCALGRSTWQRGGLGLSIVERCALAHKGQIALTNREGSGARITITMPWRSSP